jgi:hypothetical protein
MSLSILKSVRQQFNSFFPTPPRSGHVGFMADKLALEQVFSIICSILIDYPAMDAV